MPRLPLSPLSPLARRLLGRSAPVPSSYWSGCPYAGRALATATDSPAQPRPSLDNHVRLVEVGPRDGLQNEKQAIPLVTKLKLIRSLAQTGLSFIEAGSFVSPKWVPQMDQSGDILRDILQHPPSPAPTTYSFLVPNAKGLETARLILDEYPDAYAAQPDGEASGASSAGRRPDQRPAIEMAVFAAATDAFSRRNLNCDTETSLERLRPVVQGARGAGLRVRAYLSVVLGCPFEGPDVSPHRVAELATDLLEMGADEISLGDTTGMGTAPRVKDLLDCLRAAGVRSDDLALHLHDTYGQALVNSAVALEHGIRTFDSSVGGLGGCPYSPGATGNVSTENMVYFLETLGMHTGVDLDAVADVGAWITAEIGKPNDSAVGKAVLGARAREREMKAEEA